MGSHRLGACPSPWPRPLALVFLGAQSLTKRGPVGGSRTDIRAGPRPSWTPPLCVPPHKAGQGQGEEPSLRGVSELLGV